MLSPFDLIIQVYENVYAHHENKRLGSKHDIILKNKGIYVEKIYCIKIKCFYL